MKTSTRQLVRHEVPEGIDEFPSALLDALLAAIPAYDLCKLSYNRASAPLFQEIVRQNDGTEACAAFTDTLLCRSGARTPKGHFGSLLVHPVRSPCVRACVCVCECACVCVLVCLCVVQVFCFVSSTLVRLGVNPLSSFHPPLARDG